jgi:phenylalanyl-tRNA synthetase beta chain
MKFTFSWLKEYLETSLSAEEISIILTNIGLEVESFENKEKSLASFTVGKIIQINPHPNSTKLKICQVEVCGENKPLQIICGAENARANIKVAYAPIKSVIPKNGMIIKQAKIAGVESNGMLCSANELCIGDEDGGIIEIDEKWPIGTKITEVFGLNDSSFEINITPNRGDCLGIYGIASDLAAFGAGKLKEISIKKISQQISFPFELKNNAENECKFATFRYIKNVKNVESPKWLKEKLESIGIKSISAIVDITNYVMMILNRPMHVYDAKRINKLIEIRFAKKDEKFLSLKDQEILLDQETLIISDQEKLIGIAGIIGSSNSSCQLSTDEILLESAFFEQNIIAKTNRKLSIKTDAGYRFERGVDPKTCEIGIELASYMIKEICQGEFSEIKTIGNQVGNREIIFEIEKIKRLTGISITKENVIEILTKLNFSPKELENNRLNISVPTNRYDISCQEDLVEEVVRIFGYDKIQEEEMDLSLKEVKEKTNYFNSLHKIREKLTNKGMSEAITWSFINSEIVENFGKKNEELELKNPIHQEMNYMRPNMIFGLIESYKKNLSRNFYNVSFFEIGNVFGEKLETQKTVVSGLRTGENKEKNHYHDQRDFDVFDVKKDVLDIVEIFGLKAESLQISNDVPSYYHPHRSSAFMLGKNLIGYFGEIHPKVNKYFSLKNNINIFEIFIENLPQSKKKNTAKPFITIDFPIVERDFSFVINKNQPVGEIIKTVANIDKNLIQKVEIFDIYFDKNIGDEKKSVAIKTFIQSYVKTLTSEEIEEVCKKIISEIETKYSGSLRS